jgi:CheY-like chemotaxis protein
MSITSAAHPGGEPARISGSADPRRQIVILLVEDDFDDRLFITRAIHSSGINARLETVSTADEAEDYLTGRAPFEDRQRYPLPHLMLCDLILPCRSGLDLLTWLRHQSAFANIEAIAISGAGNLENISQLQRLGFKEILDKTTLVFQPSVFARAVERLLIQPG